MFEWVADDGSGLDAERILAGARQQRLIGADECPSMEHVHELLLRAGCSTAVEVSDLSGRGVGLDVVARAIR